MQITKLKHGVKELENIIHKTMQGKLVSPLKPLNSYVILVEVTLLNY